MIKCEVHYGEQCPNNSEIKAERPICEKCEEMTALYWTFCICKLKEK